MEKGVRLYHTTENPLLFVLQTATPTKKDRRAIKEQKNEVVKNKQKMSCESKREIVKNDDFLYGVLTKELIVC